MKETNQVHSKEKSIELIQKAIDKTISLNENFTGKPTLIVHPGGYSLNESTTSDVEKMQNMIVESVEELDFKNVDFLLENMPPYAWFFGGRWNCNVFLSASDMEKYCIDTGLNVSKFVLNYFGVQTAVDTIFYLQNVNSMKKFAYIIIFIVKSVILYLSIK